MIIKHNQETKLTIIFYRLVRFTAQTLLIATLKKIVGSACSLHKGAINTMIMNDAIRAAVFLPERSCISQ